MAKIRKIVKAILVTGIIFSLFFTLGAGITDFFQNMKSADTGEEVENTREKEDGERTNILVLGVDARPGEENSRSDTMMLVSVDPKLNKAAIVSIPRDTRVEIKNSPLAKICTANYIGGPEYSVKVVEDLLGINIDYYAQMDFNGFKEIIDTLGGVVIDVPQRMYKPAEGINLYPGDNQRLNGKDALGFVRYRDYVLGDIERTAQQHKFIQALADEFLQAKTITKLPKLVKHVNENLTTNMKTSDMLKIASWAPGFSTDSIIAQTLPGYFYDEYDSEGNMLQSYWIADQSQFTNLLDNMFTGKTIAAVQASPYPAQVPRKNTGNEEETTNPDGERPDQIEEDDDEEYYNRDEERSNLPSPGHAPGDRI